MGNQRESLEAIFLRRVEEIRKRAEAVGSNMTKVCAAAKIARATPDRWLKETPLTIRLVDRMDEFVRSQEEAVK